jgi:hypothetical protein
MKRILITILCAVALSVSFAKGGGSSGGGHGGGGGRASVSSAGRSSPAVSAPRANTAAAPTRTTTSTTTSTVSSTRVSSTPVAYGGMGMGYGYSNGLLTGMIIGNMMHPTNTVVYNGGGYSGNALLYPDGRVVNSNGVHVGNYVNNQFVAVQNGAMVAQTVPQDAYQPQPVIIQKTGPSAAEILLMVLGCIMVFFLLLLLIA